ncbi:methyltransferase domain-containing protein [Micromonospora sp. R77]|uniref:class I SAM-dependent DNA methyltransferase n=1 Tax=Micromonospora sp. R77 TaxID=2925836 RepID=UPI001F610C5F|nr:class I SAM-dependent methyltransferase [Micromonospora sp. R77]MCI4062875.1 methyltransferase domain-containing protein [Micromonospora sp. R77]
MTADGWLTDTRTSYDTVADSYADLLRGALADAPYERAVLALFAELVRTGGGGPVADIGCGPGRLTAHLHDLGVDAFGVDLSPAMIDIARRDHPHLRFEVGTMTELALADSPVGGLLAWFSLIHVPDDEVPTVLGHFHRVLRAGAPLLLAFHVGDEHHLKTRGYGGHPMKVYVHRRPPERVAAWLDAAGFTVEAELLHHPHSAFLFARRTREPPATSPTWSRSTTR